MQSIGHWLSSLGWPAGLGTTQYDQSPTRPLFQTEIHLHPSNERHREMAAEIFATYSENPSSDIGMTNL